MNKNFPLITRHRTLKKYAENYDSDLQHYLKSYEDNREIDFLENDLFCHQELLNYFLTKSPDWGKFDDTLLQDTNSQKRIIEFIERKLSESLKMMQPTTEADRKKMAQQWFIVGKQFATGFIQERYNSGISGNAIAKQLGDDSYRNTITETIANSKKSSKNIYKDYDKMRFILEQCLKEETPICDDFIDNYNLLKPL